MNEADTCRIYVEPKLRAAGWETPPHSVASQPVIAPGKIVPQGKKARRLEAQRPDYLLRYAPNQTVAVVEAKREGLPASAGMQQAKGYAEKLGLAFAYATNGKKIVRFNYLTGREREMDAIPTPEELWGWLHPGTDATLQTGLLTPYYSFPNMPPRYYQAIAINRTVQAILSGQRRSLLTLATGTGKTFVAFQICWRLWDTRWNMRGEHRRPKILYLADRGVDLAELRTAAGRPEADPFDLLCFVAYGGPLYTRRERAERLRRQKANFFDRYGPEARAVLDDLLDKNVEHGLAQFDLRDLLQVPPIATRGNLVEIVGYFQGAERMHQAVDQMQALLYAA